MQLYRLSIGPDESAGEGENLDEWFTSLRAAKKRRRALIDENPTGDNTRYNTDFGIDLVDLAVKGLTRKHLAVMLLNGRKFINKTTRVVEPYEFDRNEHMRQVIARLAEDNVTSEKVT